MPTKQNGQTHSSNSLALVEQLFECIWPTCGFALKGLMKNTADVSLNVSQNEAAYVNKHRGVFKVSFVRQLTETRLALSLSSCKNID